MINKSRAKFYKWEKILKGAANHRRLEILELLEKENSLSTEDIVDKLNINYHTGASHARYLLRSGLVSTRREGSSVIYSISDTGKSILIFVQRLK